MTAGVKTWLANGAVSFESSIRTIRQTEKLLIQSGESGSIALSELPNGIDGVLFDPAWGWSDSGIVPHATVSGGRLHWRGGSGAFYLTIIGVAR